MILKNISKNNYAKNKIYDFADPDIKFNSIE